MSRGVRRALAGAVAAQVVTRLLERHPPGGEERWRRPNYRGTPVSLVAGPALVLALSAAGPGLPGAAAALGAGLAGRYDDVADESGGAKGFGGHLGALRAGRLTAGAVKLVGISATGLLVAACLRPRRDVLLSGAVIAGTANLINLLDLRPGRALKAGLVGAAVLGQPGVVGSCAALLPADLGERRMLGDAGANALGAVLGVALVQRVASRGGRWTALLALVALTAASERVSFSRVIEGTPALRRFDEVGRRP